MSADIHPPMQDADDRDRLGAILIVNEMCAGGESEIVSFDAADFATACGPSCQFRKTTNQLVIISICLLKRPSLKCIAK